MPSTSTRADCDAGCAETDRGTEGATAVSGVTGLDAAEAGPAPLGLIASTRNV